MSMLYERRPRSLDTPRVEEHDVTVEDLFVNEKFEEINSEVKRLAAIGTAYYEENGLDIHRKRKSGIDMDNPATQELCEMLPSVGDWLDTVPTAAALHPLYEPMDTKLPNGKPLDDKIGDWFRNIADARGMRSRAKVMENLLEQEVKESDISEPQRWLSLACGAALPVFSTMHRLQSQQVLLPEVTLVDADKNALSLARNYAKHTGLENNIETKRMNILEPAGLAYERREGAKGIAQAALLRRRGRMPAGTFDAVDAVGIFEYLQEPDWKYTYNKVISTSKEMAGAQTFLKNAYELVKPGGLLIVGNMLDTHPQLEFTLNVIQWPHIQPRSIDEMTKIINKVGIEGDVDVYKPDDGVYAIYGIRKPL